MQEQSNSQSSELGNLGDKPLPKVGAIFRLDLKPFAGALLPELSSVGVLLLVLDDTDLDEPLSIPRAG
jgi:hypothetical protein